MNSYSDDIYPMFDVAVKISRLMSPLLNIHFRLYLNFYNDQDVRLAFVWVGYNMYVKDDPNSVDAPIRIQVAKQGCDSRLASIVTENIVADHVIFKVTSKNLVIVDDTVIDLSHISCHDNIGWINLFSAGSVSKMKLYVQEIINIGYGEPTSDNLSFSYKTENPFGRCLATGTGSSHSLSTFAIA